MAFNINPLTWKAFALSLRNKAFDEAMRQFQGQVSDFCSQVQSLLTPSRIAATLSGSSFLQMSAFKHINATTINGSTDCTGAGIVTCSLALTTNSTMTLNNVADGTMIDLRISNTSGSTWNFFLAANKPGGGAYVVSALLALAGAERDMTATGFNCATATIAYFRGIAQLTTSQLNVGYV